MNPDHARFADWDAAYVLGALSPTERREFETHLETCDICRAAVAELAPMPGLLARVTPDQAAALLDDPAPRRPIDAPPADLVNLVVLEDHRRRRRRTSRILIASAAAVVLIAGAIIVPLTLGATQQQSERVAMAQVSESPLTATVALTEVKWGTKLDMVCDYAESGSWAVPQPSGAWSYAMYVTDRQGDTREVSSWNARSGSTVKLTAASSVLLDDIASVEIRSIATDAVLLRADLAD